MKLTDATIKQAKTYIPLMKKIEWATEVSERCVLKIAITGEGNAPMPPMFIPDSGAKSRALMALLVGEYLGQKLDLTDDYFMSADDYDRHAHTFNQLERMKKFSSDIEVKDKVFDLISDYKDCEKRLNEAVYNNLQVMNDICLRVLTMIEMQSTPEALKTAMAEMQAVKGELETRGKNG